MSFNSIDSTAVAADDCNNMGCLDYSCTDADTCDTACFLVEEMHCTFSGVNDFGTAICGELPPVQG